MAVALIVISLSSCSVCSHWANRLRSVPVNTHSDRFLTSRRLALGPSVSCACACCVFRVYVRECVLVCPLQPQGCVCTWVRRFIKSLRSNDVWMRVQKKSQRRHGTFKRTIIVLLQSVWCSFAFWEGSGGGSPLVSPHEPLTLTPRLLPFTVPVTSVDLNPSVRLLAVRCRLVSHWIQAAALTATPASYSVSFLLHQTTDIMNY